MARPSGVRKILKEGKGKLNLLAGWEPEPLQVLCADFTEVKYAGGARKAYLLVMIDPGSGWVPGWAAGSRGDREPALRCWEAAKESLAKGGQDPRGLIVHYDQNLVYTSYRCLRKLLIEDKGVVSYCERGTKHNPWMESFWPSRQKQEDVPPLLDPSLTLTAIDVNQMQELLKLKVNVPVATA